MIISHKYKFVFIHVPKTGGMSIDNALIYHLGEEDLITNPTYISGVHTHAQHPEESLVRKKDGIYHHTHIKELNKLFKNKFKDYFKFTFVRDPYARMVSLYSFYSQLGGFRRAPWHRTDIQKFREWITEENNNINPRLGIKGQNAWKYKPQSEWLIDENDKIGVDFIGKTENFKNDLLHICKHVGLEIEDIPHKNKSKHHHYSLFYTEKAREKVKKAYMRDFKEFDYDTKLKISGE